MTLQLQASVLGTALGPLALSAPPSLAAAPHRPPVGFTAERAPALLPFTPPIQTSDSNLPFTQARLLGTALGDAADAAANPAELPSPPPPLPEPAAAAAAERAHVLRVLREHFGDVIALAEGARAATPTAAVQAAEASAEDAEAPGKGEEAAEPAEAAEAAEAAGASDVSQGDASAGHGSRRWALSACGQRVVVSEAEVGGAWEVECEEDEAASRVRRLIELAQRSCTPARTCAPPPATEAPAAE